MTPSDLRSRTIEPFNRHAITTRLPPSAVKAQSSADTERMIYEQRAAVGAHDEPPASWATQAIERRVPLTDVMIYLRHTNLDMSYDHYVARTDPMVRRIALAYEEDGFD